MKQRKPCQRPKSLRVHRYRPPAPGYFTESAATAMARGTMKSTAASSHSVTEPGPACAAAGIQRVPTMHAMAKNVMSRRPSSRFSCGERSSIEALDLGVKLDGDAAQSLAEEFGFSAQPDADVAFQSEVGAGNNQHALVDADAFAELKTRGGGLIAHQAEGARLGFAEGKEARETSGPFPHDGQVVLQDGAGARVEFLAILRAYRDARHGVGDFVGSDGDVVVLAPAFGDDGGGSGDPADAHAGDTVRLGKPAGDDDAVAHAQKLGVRSRAISAPR